MAKKVCGKPARWAIYAKDPTLVTYACTEHKDLIDESDGKVVAIRYGAETCGFIGN